MIEDYKLFLEEKMNSIINTTKQEMKEPINVYTNFIDDEYFGVIEDSKDVYLIVLNSHKDNVIKLPVLTTDYKRIQKFDLKNTLAPKTFNKLLRNGLYMSEYSGKNNNNGYVCIQRLVACIRGNILGHEVDHIDSNPLNNNVDNLKPLITKEHSKKTTKSREYRRVMNGEVYITL